MAHEHFRTKKLHTNLVLCYTRFFIDDIIRALVSEVDENKIAIANGDVNHIHHYQRITYGTEHDYGSKKLDIKGVVNTDALVLNQK